MKTQLKKINICPRVDLYLNNQGFRFTNSLYPPDENELLDWKKWKFSWQVYERDNIKSKIKSFLDSFPDRFKSETFYQNLNFQN